MSKREINGIRAIVTGASSGIGRAAAVELARGQSRSGNDATGTLGWSSQRPIAYSGV
jgi:NAD(P)-dependent dehydrogenase (short-subunit alcohol dehydrogenase family)